MDTIKYEHVQRAVRLLGYNPSDVKSLIIDALEVRVTVFERDEHGNKIWNADHSAARTRTEVCNY